MSHIHEIEKRNNHSPSSASSWSDRGPTPAQSLTIQGGAESCGGTSLQEGKMKIRGSGGSRNGRSSTSNEAGREHTGYLRMRGLPFSATRKEVADFFKMYKPHADSIVFSYRSDGRATGEAYISFASAEDSNAAMALNRKSIGSRYIELFVSSKEEHRRMVMRNNGL